MDLDQDIFQQLMDSFREELAERLASITAGLLILEQNPDAEHQETLLEELFRNVHSLKGAARAVDLKPIEELAHGMEDVFGAAKRGSIHLDAPLFDLLYHGVDLTSALMTDIEEDSGLDSEVDLSNYLFRLATAWRGQPIQSPRIEESTQQPLAGVEEVHTPTESILLPWNDDTIRVPTDRLDQLMANAGELLIARLRSSEQVEAIKDLYDFSLRWQRDWQQAQGTVSSSVLQSENDTGTQIQDLFQKNLKNLQTIVTRLGIFARKFSDDANRLSLVTDEIQEGVRQTRMLPLATLLGGFRRIVRDLARQKGIEVSMQVHGTGTEMDKHVLEQIKDPLMHMLRNCIDHGIEPPVERSQAGKPRQGVITLTAERCGGVIVIEISDDGRGIDINAVRDTAVRRGLLEAETAAEMSDVQIIPLIFTPGLSTAPIITEISGRGIGLDVVRRNVEVLQGRTHVQSIPGQGTSFTLVLPLTLISTYCLLVGVADYTYALPFSSVERIVPIRPEDISIIGGQQAIHWMHRPISLVRLADVLQQANGDHPFANRRKLPAVILSAGEQRIAFLVDELLDEEEVVVKSLGKQLARVPNVAGATVLGTGEVVLILNPSDMIRSARRATIQSHIPTVPSTSDQESKTVLIVDDSITTRTLEKNILTTAGYQVQLAVDGQEALAILAENRFDLVVADIDMPRLNGFGLTERIRQDESHTATPVILVTSLDSPEHKARGIEVGADAYIVKGSFDQDVLLNTIRQLI
jgi:two-component system chemotaxis sensor kinase CheA